MKGRRRQNPQSSSFGYWVFRVNRAMHSALSARLAALGVTSAEWTVLSQAARGGVTPVSLAERMGIDRAAVTRIIDQLETKNLMRRTPHPTDSRSTVLELTVQGEEILPKLVAASKATNGSFLNLLPPSDRAVVPFWLHVIAHYKVIMCAVRCIASAPSAALTFASSRPALTTVKPSLPS